MANKVHSSCIKYKFGNMYCIKRKDVLTIKYRKDILRVDMFWICVAVRLQHGGWYEK